MIDHRNLGKIKLLAMDVDGVLTDGCTWQNQDGTCERRFSVRDSIAMRQLMRVGYQIALFASFSELAVETHFRSLNVSHYFANCRNKAEELEKLLVTLGLRHENAGYISESSADLGLLRTMGFSATVINARPELKTNVDFVSSHESGDGALRDVSSLLLAGGFYSEYSSMHLKKAIGT